jgi:hypothetical protein
MKLLLIAAFCWLIAGPGLAQTIRFAGLKRTQPAYLRKVIGPVGGPLDSLAAQQVAQRVKNTRLFSQVEAQLAASPGDTALVLTCREVRTLSYASETGENLLEPGQFQIMVGPNARDLQKAELRLK